MSGSELSQNGADIYNHCEFCEIAEILPRKRKRGISISNGREVPLLRFCRFPHCHSRQWDPVELRWGVGGSIANRLKGGPAGGAMESQGQARGRHEHAVCGLHGWCRFSLRLLPTPSQGCPPCRPNDFEKPALGETGTASRLMSDVPPASTALKQTTPMACCFSSELFSRF